MSAEPTFSTSDLRSNAQDFKRDAAQKHKWALGSVQPVGRAFGHPKPQRPAKTDYNFKRQTEAARAVAVAAHSGKVTRKFDILEGPTISDDSCGSNSDEDVPSPALDAGVMYSFDAPKGPSQGSQILTLALSKAVERFEERETAKLVHNEYDVLDSDGETVPMSPDKKRKNKHRQVAAASSSAVPDVDDDYEFV